jgi:hypothetical protein
MEGSGRGRERERRGNNCKGECLREKSSVKFLVVEDLLIAKHST